MTILHTDRPIVAFDFDGTLSHFDSFSRFVFENSDKKDLLLKVISLSPTLLAIGASHDRSIEKMKIFNRLCQFSSKQDYGDKLMVFFERYKDTIWRSDALKKWKFHQEAGHFCVIVSGSLSPLLAAFAKHLKADYLIATDIIFDREQNKFKAITKNCVREQKLIRLKEAFGDDFVLDYAYGDSRGDHEMIAYAKHGFLKLFIEKN